VTNQWVLFGLDLTRLVDRLNLGLAQLLWSEEVGLRRWFYPAARLLNADTADLDAYPRLISRNDQSEQDLPNAVLFPAELTLSKMVELPLDAEIDLPTAMKFEVLSNSPFTEQDTAFGWRTVSREAGSLRVALVIASRAKIISLLEEHTGFDPEALLHCEVWVQTHDLMVQFAGFGGAVRRALYFRRLANWGGKVTAMALALFLLLAIPAAMLSVRSSQIAELLVATELEAESAAAARNTLVTIEDNVLVAREFFAGRVSYDRWLDVIADLTPDSVYLTRMGLEEDRLTISGMAENAAEYQTTLAASGLTSELSAPSAFTRDARTGLERFTLTMQLGAQE